MQSSVVPTQPTLHSGFACESLAIGQSNPSRKRASRACMSCQRVKKKCIDQGPNGCKACRHNSLPCIYIQGRKRGKQKRTHTEAQFRTDVRTCRWAATEGISWNENCCSCPTCRDIIAPILRSVKSGTLKKLMRLVTSDDLSQHEVNEPEDSVHVGSLAASCQSPLPLPPFSDYPLQGESNLNIAEGSPMFHYVSPPSRQPGAQSYALGYATRHPHLNGREYAPATFEDGSMISPSVGRQFHGVEQYDCSETTIPQAFPSSWSHELAIEQVPVGSFIALLNQD